MDKCLELTKLNSETEENDWEDISDESENENELEDDNDDDEEEEESEINQTQAAEDNENLSDDDDQSDVVELEEDEEDFVDENAPVDKTKFFPNWFLNKLHPANLPRYFVDLKYLRKYINSPQIEHFPYPDCHEVALPILKYIFTLLHTIKGKEVKPKKNKDGEIIPLSFSYMTRAQKISQVRFYRYELEQSLPQSFDPYNPDPLFMHHLFDNTLKDIDTNVLFCEISKLPADLRLYFLSIVYWMYKSPHYDILHLHALLICVVVLRTVDSCIPPERDIKAFNKRFGKIIKRERNVREREFAETGIPRGIRADLLLLSVPQRIQYVQKSDCFLVKDRLLKHFHMQEVFKKKYDNFSTIVLHGFSEFQSILFQLYGLNSLLDFPYEATKMANCFCGVFLYNIYDLLRTRVNIVYFVQQSVLRDSPLMFDFYNFLLNWCMTFLPKYKQGNTDVANSKKVLKKQRQLAQRKSKLVEKSIDPNAEMLSESSETGIDSFLDLNNKFCALTVCK